MSTSEAKFGKANVPSSFMNRGWMEDDPQLIPVICISQIRHNWTLFYMTSGISLRYHQGRLIHEANWKDRFRQQIGRSTHPQHASISPPPPPFSSWTGNGGGLATVQTGGKATPLLLAMYANLHKLMQSRPFCQCDFCSLEHRQSLLSAQGSGTKRTTKTHCAPSYHDNISKDSAWRKGGISSCLQ